MATVAKYLLFMLSIISMGQTKYMEGELNTGDNWAFLARFCFLSLHGKFEYDIEYPEVGSVGVKDPVTICLLLSRCTLQRTWTSTMTQSHSGPGCMGTAPT